VLARRIGRGGMRDGSSVLEGVMLYSMYTFGSA